MIVPLDVSTTNVAGWGASESGSRTFFEVIASIWNEAILGHRDVADSNYR